VSGKRVYLLLVTLIATMLVVAACSEVAVPTQEPVEFHPTAAASIDRPDSSDDDSGSAAAAPESGTGDADAGRNLFISCGGCHSTDDSQVVGPGLGGIYARAGERTSLDADAYIAQSLREPGAFVVDGFPAVMPSFSYLGDDDIQNLIAYLKTLE
jgi:cytochrome c2